MSTSINNIVSNEYGDSFQNLINVSDNNVFDSRLKSFVRDEILKKNPGKNEVNSFIKGEKSPADDSEYVDFLYSIENNNNFSLNEDLVNSIISYKKQIIENKFNNVKNKLNSFLNINDNYVYLHNSVLEKFDDTQLAINYIIKGIEEKTLKIKNNSFENIFKKEIFEESGFYFNTVTNFFINNVFLDFDNTSFDEPNNYFLIRRESIDLNRVNYSEENFLRDSLIKLDRSFPFEFVKPIKNTSNDIVIQSVINTARSFYTLSTNSFLNNYVRNETLIKDYDTSSLINLTSERSELDIFKSINEKNNTINYQQIILNKSIKDFTPSEFRLNGFREFTIQDTQVIERNRIDLENVLNIDTQTFPGGEYFQKVGIELNKYFTDSIFNINLDDTFLWDSDPAFNEEFKNPANKIKSDDNNLLFGFTSAFNPLAPKFTQAYYNIFRGNLIESDNSGSPQNNEYNVELFESNGRKFLTYNKIYYKDKNLFFKNSEELNNDNTSAFNNTGDSFNAGTAGPNESLLQGNLSNNVSQNILAQINKSFQDFSEILLKSEIDAFIKNIKLKNIANNDTNIDNFNEVIKNIKNNTSIDKNEIVSYSKENEKNISAIYNKNKMYNLLFTESNTQDKTYSHTDIVSNHNVNNNNYVGLDSLKKDDENFNDDREKIKNDFKKLLSNYYPKCNFFSSTKFFKSIFKNVLLENTKENPISESYMLTQALYLNIFRGNNNLSFDDNTKEIITKRFLKKSIMLDSTSDFNLNSNKMSDYVYDIDNITLEDYDNSSKASMKSYIDKILNSSQNLKKIKDSVFSLNNIKSLSHESDYKCFNNLNVISNERNKLYFINNSNQNQKKVVLNGLMFHTFLPFKTIKYEYAVTDKVLDKLSLKHEIETKNKVREVLDNEENKVYLIDEENCIDITTEHNIKVRIYPRYNDFYNSRKDSLYRSNNIKFPYTEIKDNFKKTCEEENTIFNLICKEIQVMLRLSSKKYKNSFFSNQEEIDSFISQEKSLLKEVEKILKFYAIIYLNYFNRVQRTLFLNFFDQVNNQDFTSLDEVQRTAIQSKINLSNFNSKINFAVNADVSDLDFGKIVKTSDFISQGRNIYLNNNNLTKDFISITNASNNEQYELDISEDVYFKSNFYRKSENILKSLYKSDSLQAFNFDIINGCIDYQDDMENMTRDEISHSMYLNKLKEVIDEDDAAEIEDNFYNLFFINFLSKQMFKSLYINEKIENLFRQGILEQNVDYLKNNVSEILDQLKELEINELGSFLKSVSTDKIGQLSSSESSENYLNSSFYYFGLKKNIMNNLNFESLIKITINIVDRFNLNHLYIPKVFLFSPLYTDIGPVLDSDYSEITNKESIGYFRLNENINNRLGAIKIDSAVETINEETDSFLKSIIAKKFNTRLNSDKCLALCKHLMNCHFNSKNNHYLVKSLYGINSLDERIEKIDYNILEIIQSLNAKDFFNLFDVKKSKVFENGEIRSKNLYESTELKEKVYETIKYASKIGNIDTFNEKEYYDTYMISINPKDFIYHDITEAVESSNNIPSVREILVNNDHKERLLISGMDRFIETENLNLFKSLQSVENLNISVKVEIL